jgi:hypothetical protein
MADGLTHDLPQSWSIHDGTQPDQEVLRSFDVLLNGKKVSGIRSYDCGRGIVRVVDVEASIKAGECIEREIKGSVTLLPR